MKRHRLDVLSLVFGLLFVCFACLALIDNIGINPLNVRWIFALGLLVAGLATLLSTTRSTPNDD